MIKQELVIQGRYFKIYETTLPKNTYAYTIANLEDAPFIISLYGEVASEVCFNSENKVTKIEIIPLHHLWDIHKLEEYSNQLLDLNKVIKQFIKYLQSMGLYA